MQFNKRSTRRQFLKAAGLGLGTLALPSRATPPVKSSHRQPFTFVQLCDPQLGFGGYEHDVATFTQAVKQINALRPDFVLICGDLVHKRTEAALADFLRIKAGLTMPCYCAAGNHDVGQRPTRESLEDFRKGVDRDYFAFEHKGHLFAIVNTQLWKAPLPDESAQQDVWLTKILGVASNQAMPIFIAGHYPLFTKEAEEDEKYDNLPISKRKELLKLFEQHGVVAMLGGHTHKLVINDYRGIQLVNGETTSKNVDHRPMGFRLWHVGDSRPFRHDFVALENF